MFRTNQMYHCRWENKAYGTSDSLPGLQAFAPGIGGLEALNGFLSMLHLLLTPLQVQASSDRSWRGALNLETKIP